MAASTDAFVWLRLYQQELRDIAGHAVVQNLRRGHYELGVDAHPALRTTAAFTELAPAI